MALTKFTCSRCSRIPLKSNEDVTQILDFNRCFNWFPDFFFTTALAFCNNSDLQRKRRQILQKFTFPHAHSSLGTLLDQLCKDECQHLVASIHQMQNGRQDTKIDMKPLIRKACANIFSRYFCSVPRCDYDDKDFSDYTHNMDQVFWEINNGRAVDFLPWLMPYFQHSSAMATMKESSQKVRSYVKGNIIATKRKARASNEGSEKKDADFLDSIMDYIDGKANGDPEALLTSQSALFALEDILGGHAAVANIILRILHDLSLSDHVEAKTEVSKQLQNRPGSWDFVSSDERQHLPWVVAAMHETIRMTCSPIVPHQAAQDSTIGGNYNNRANCDLSLMNSLIIGYLVPKDTVIFVNNHALNMNEELWSTHSPEAYQPQRFLHPTTGEFSKPAHFQPFSMGKRSCVGYKMVHNVAFSLVSNLMMHFDIHSPAWAPENVPLGMLALPPEPFTFTLSPAVSCATKTPLDSAPIPPLCIRTSA